MLKVQVARLEALQAVQQFMDTNAAVLGAVNQSRARATLDGIVTRLRGQRALQHGAREQATSRTDHLGELRDVLKIEHMQPIATIAASKLAATPDITKLRMPRGHVSTLRLVAAGEAMAAAAEKYKQVFLDEQLPQDFVEQLRTAATGVEQALVARTGSRAEQVQATEGTADLCARGAAVVKVLNSLVLKQLAGDSEEGVRLRRGWRFVKHLSSKRGGQAEGTVTPAPNPAVIPITQQPAVIQGPGEVRAA
jgi:hypothetical protein